MCGNSFGLANVPLTIKGKTSKQSLILISLSSSTSNIGFFIVTQMNEIALTKHFSQILPLYTAYVLDRLRYTYFKQIRLGYHFNDMTYKMMTKHNSPDGKLSWVNILFTCIVPTKDSGEFMHFRHNIGGDPGEFTIRREFQHKSGHQKGGSTDKKSLKNAAVDILINDVSYTNSKRVDKFIDALCAQTI
ncbi:hypothetical protein AGLY_002580 [Aphis glycines]|uniref:Uncharacterized protein n=1 Tax=Aphis glycines TaxID=307491 RepID=A0A6G0U216_APHGL|nr:hypothetical protein AGLY_002580 [Aphis glycines]